METDYTNSLKGFVAALDPTRCLYTAVLVAFGRTNGTFIVLDDDF